MLVWFCITLATFCARIATICLYLPKLYLKHYWSHFFPDTVYTGILSDLQSTSNKKMSQHYSNTILINMSKCHCLVAVAVFVREKTRRMSVFGRSARRTVINFNIITIPGCEWIICLLQHILYLLRNRECGKAML